MAGPINVLIVEDDAFLRCEMAEMFVRLGAQAFQAETIAEAVATASANQPDIIFCDYRLQAENGLDCLRHIDDLAFAPAPYKVLMTGHMELTGSSRNDIAELADELLAKPVPGMILRKLIDARRC